MKYPLMVIVVGCVVATSSFSSQTSDMTRIFPEISGMLRAGEPDLYAPESLYQYIDGAAEVYLSYGFQELATQIYENKQKQSLTIEVYRHSNPTNGFGVYSHERLVDGNFLRIGAQGYYEEGILNFVRGNYYVKLSAFNLGDDEKSVLTAVAKDVADRLERELDFPQIIGSFPKKGKVENSERFIPENFLGYSFFEHAFTCDYSISEKNFKLFVIEAVDSTECKRTLRKYMKSTRHSGVEIREGRYTIEDPHYGEVDLFWQGKHIWGILGLEDPNLRSNYIVLIERILGNDN